MQRPRGHRQDTQSRWLVIAIVVGLAGIAGYFALGMPGMDHSSPAPADGSMAGMAHRSGAGYESLSPAAFEGRMRQGDAVVVNVHVPYEGQIPGTDVLVPYDEVATAMLDPAAQVLLYCRTGDMSADAATRLVAEGYSRVAHLAGGMVAWEASGRPVTRSGP